MNECGLGGQPGKPVPRKERTREGLREAFTVENAKKAYRS